MLHVDGSVVDSLELSTLLQLSSLQLTCSNFLSQLTTANQHRSAEAPPESLPCLCLLQGEEAAVNARHFPIVIGSQDATTCMIAVMYCPATQLVWSAHVDQALGMQDIRLLNDLLSQMQQPQLHLAGAYCDRKGAGPRTAQAFLQLLHVLPAVIELRLCCVAAANTASDGSPCTCQLMFNTVTQTPHPWVAKDRGPEVPRRFAAQHCRYYSDSVLINVWCFEQQQYVLQPFNPTCLNSWAVMRYEQMLEWPDQQLLQVMSTSPQHEPQCFCQDMRHMMHFLIAAQEPDSAERKAASTTSRYCWCSSSRTWRPVTGDQQLTAAQSLTQAQQAIVPH